MVNRNRGSGTRLWLDLQLLNLGMDPHSINGYAQEAMTHTAVAQAIASQSAQVGLGLRAAAFRSSLDFIPLYQERYDLVIQKEQSENHALSQLIDQLESGAFRQALRSLPGYDAEHTGECTSIH